MPLLVQITERNLDKVRAYSVSLSMGAAMHRGETGRYDATRGGETVRALLSPESPRQDKSRPDLAAA